MNPASTGTASEAGGTAILRQFLTCAGVHPARSSESRPRRLVQLRLVVLLTVSALPLQAFIAPAANADALPFETPKPQWVVPELSSSATFASQGPGDSSGTVSAVVTSAPPVEAGTEDIVWTGEETFDGGWAWPYWPVGDSADGTYWARMTISPAGARKSTRLN